MQTLLLVATGGAIGSILRFLISLLFTKVWASPFPLATLVINVAGALAMGLLMGTLIRLEPSWMDEARLFAAVGVLGGFTTFSAFSLEAVALLEGGLLAQALLYVGLSIVLCLVGLYAGLLLTRGIAA